MVALAPHLVRPLPLVVPAFDGARPDRLVGVGLNLYDVMAVDKLARAPPRAARGARRARRVRASWSPERHRMIPGEEVVERCPRSPRATRPSGYLFYDCQTDDVAARADRARRGRALRRGLREPARRSLELVEEAGRAAGVRVRDGETGERVRRPRRERRQRDRRVGRPHPARRSCTTRPRCRASRPSRGTHITLSPRAPAARSTARSSRRARGARSSRCRGSGSTLDRHDRQRLRRGDLDHIRPAESRHRLPARRATNDFFGTELTRRRPEPARSPACGR